MGDLSDDDNWSLTTERISKVLDDVRKTPCPRSACCMDDVDRVRFALHIIAEKALAELLDRRAAQTASAERLREVVREVVRAAVEYAATKAVDAALGEVSRQVGAMGHVLKEARGAGLAAVPTDAIADRVAAQLAAPPPGHVCPMPYGLGPEELDVLSELVSHAELVDWPHARAAVRKVLAAHTCPEPTIDPLPEVIGCGTVGCVSSIKKSYLPSGWRLTDGVWACPRCKVLATQEAS
jgi:hypothetical protein